MTVPKLESDPITELMFTIWTLSLKRDLFERDRFISGCK